MTNVLIVEDEESLADPLAFLLRKEGFEATVATDGPSALAEFDRAGADIVLLDLMLPGMTGTDVCKQLRARSSVPATRARRKRLCGACSRLKAMHSSRNSRAERARSATRDMGIVSPQHGAEVHRQAGGYASSASMTGGRSAKSRTSGPARSISSRCPWP